MKPYIQDQAQRNIYQFLGWYDEDGVQRYNPVTDRWYEPETRRWSKEYTYCGAKDLVLTARGKNPTTSPTTETVRPWGMTTHRKRIRA